MLLFYRTENELARLSCLVAENIDTRRARLGSDSSNVMLFEDRKDAVRVRLLVRARRVIGDRNELAIVGLLGKIDDIVDAFIDNPNDIARKFMPKV